MMVIVFMIYLISHVQRWTHIQSVIHYLDFSKKKDMNDFLNVSLDSTSFLKLLSILYIDNNDEKCCGIISEIDSFDISYNMRNMLDD